jgi:hypothetical protein
MDELREQGNVGRLGEELNRYKHYDAQSEGSEH